MAKQIKDTPEKAIAKTENTVQKNIYERLDAASPYSEGTSLKPSTVRYSSRLKPTVEKVKEATGREWNPQDGLKELSTLSTKVDYDIAKTKADEQGLFGELGAFGAQAVSEIGLGTLEGVGYLLDFKQNFNLLTGNKVEWDNWFSKAMSGAKEEVAAWAPIYQDPGNENRSFWENMWQGDGWWAQNGVSIASTASMFIPVMGAVKGLSAAGKGLSLLGKTAKTAAATNKFGKTVGKGTRWIDEGAKLGKEALETGKLGKIGEIISDPKFVASIGEGIASGIVSRHLESTIEATGTFRDKYEEYLAKGFTRTEANQAAAEGAAFAYRENMAIAGVDILQHILIGKGFSANKAISSAKLAKAEGASVAAAVARSVANPLTQFVSEGFEEYYQFGVAEESKYVADVALGLKKPRDGGIVSRLQRSWNESEAWTSAFFGGLGGLAFSSIGPKIKSSYDNLFSKNSANMSERDRRLAEVQERWINVNNNVKAYQEAVENNNEKGAAVIKSRMATDAGIRAAEAGNLNGLLDSLERLKKATPEERRQYEIDDEYMDDFVSNIDGFISDANDAALKYEKNRNIFDNNERGIALARQVTSLQMTQQHFQKRKPELQKEIETINATIPFYTEATPEAQGLFNQLLQVKTLERVKTITEKSLAETPEDEAKKKYLDEINTTLSEVKEIVKDIPTLSTKDQALIDSVNSTEGIELSKLKSEQELINYTLATIPGQIQEYLGMNKATVTQETAKPVSNDKQSEILGDTEPVSQNNEISIASLQSNPQMLNMIEMGLNSGDISLESFTKEVQDYIISQRNSNSSVDVDVDNSSEIEETSEVELPVDTNPAESLNSNHELAVGYIDMSDIPDNPTTDRSWRLGDDREDISITNKVNTLAWKSVNNSETKESEKTPENIALSNFLENQPSLSDITVRFDINYSWLNNNKNDIKYKDIREQLNSGSIPSNIGEVPIVANLYRDNKPIIENDIQLQMSLHDDSFFFTKEGTPLSENSEAQAQATRDIKTKVLQAINDNVQLEAKVTRLSNGNLNIIPTKAGAYARNKISDVLGKDISTIEFIYGDENEYYINPSTKKRDNRLNIYTSSTKGAIYALTKTANGSYFPLRLQSSKLTKSEAELIYDIYYYIFAESSSTSPYSERGNNNISDELIQTIKSSSDPRISSILDYIGESVTYDELLNQLVFYGAKGSIYGDNRLEISLVRNVPTLLFGTDGKMTPEAMSSPGVKNILKQAFVSHLMEFRNRQIDSKRLNDNNYKQYINDNNILTSNAVKATEGPLFVQPVLEFDSNYNVVVNNVEPIEETITNDILFPEIVEESTEEGNTTDIEVKMETTDDKIKKAKEARALLLVNKKDKEASLQLDSDNLTIFTNEKFSQFLKEQRVKDKSSSLLELIEYYKKCK